MKFTAILFFVLALVAVGYSRSAPEAEPEADPKPQNLQCGGSYGGSY